MSEKLIRNTLAHFALAMFTMIYTHSVEADEGEWYVETSVGYYHSSDDGGSYPGTDVFAQYSFDERNSFFFFSYKDRDFTAVYAGAARKFGELELGVGLGEARYDQIVHFVVNPWLNYESGPYAAYVYLEYVPSDKDVPLFYKMDAKRDFGESVFAGLYAEKFFGIGPMLGLKLTDNIGLQLAVPLINKSKYDEKNAYITLNVSF